MRRRDRGFTLVEVMITLVVLMLAMSAVSAFFLGVIRQFKQQSRIAQTGMDSIVGLQILRKDIEAAGYGLPWNNLPAYVEAASGTAAALNDASGSAPRGIVSAENVGLNASDYLAVKAVNVAMNDACRKWTTLQTGDEKRGWTTVPADAENLNDTDRVIVVSPGSGPTNWRSLVVPAADFYTTFDSTGAFAPLAVAETRVVYGIDEAGAPTRPFNRADYFIDTISVPQRCAPNTGVLVKAVVRQSDGALDTPLPLLDCVASMKVAYLRDVDGDGAIDEAQTTGDVSGLTAQQVRDQVRRVEVSILAHEGQYDEKYTHAATNIPVGLSLVTSVDITGAAFLGKGRNYRWKAYNLVVTPDNLRN